MTETSTKNKAAIRLIDEWFESEPTEATPEPEPLNFGDLHPYTEQQIEGYCEKVTELRMFADNHPEQAALLDESIQIIRQLQGILSERAAAGMDRMGFTRCEGDTKQPTPPGSSSLGERGAIE